MIYSIYPNHEICCRESHTIRGIDLFLINDKFTFKLTNCVIEWTWIRASRGGRIEEENV